MENPKQNIILKKLAMRLRPGIHGPDQSRSRWITDQDNFGYKSDRWSLIKYKYNLDVDNIFPSYGTRERRKEKFFENLNRTGRFYPDDLNHLLETEADEELDLLMNHLSQGSKLHAWIFKNVHFQKTAHFASTWGRSLLPRKNEEKLNGQNSDPD